MAQISREDQISKRVTIKASPEKFYGFLKHQLTELPKIDSSVKSVQLVQGKEGEVGNVKHFVFVDTDTGVTTSVEMKATVFDDKGITTGEVIKGEVLEQYPSLHVTATVSPGHVVWTIKYTKANPFVPAPHHILAQFVKITKPVDDHLTHG